MATKDDCLKLLDSKGDAATRQAVFDAFHAEGIALVPHEMLRMVAQALINSSVRIAARRALAAELAKLAPGVVR